MKFSIVYDFRNPVQRRRPWADLYAETLDHINAMETMGFDAIWSTEHADFTTMVGPVEVLRPVVAAKAAWNGRVDLHPSGSGRRMGAASISEQWSDREDVRMSINHRRRVDDENMGVIRRHFEEAINEHDVSVYDNIMALDYRLTVGLRDDLLEGGRRGYQNGLQQFWEGFPDMRVEILDLIAEDDRVVAHYIERATHTGTYADLPPTGRSYIKHGFGLYVVREGLMVSGWVQEDDLAFRTCVGVDTATPGG